mgnify:CR=1 FL=1
MDPMGDPTKTHVVQHAPRARVHRHTLIEINISVFTGRRDAAHERLLQILRHEMAGGGREYREKLYAFSIWLLDQAIRSTRRSQVQADSRVIHYLGLLRDTLSASYALVRHEMTLSRGRDELSEVLDPQVLTQLQPADESASDAERNLMDSINDVLTFGQAVIASDTQERIRKFRGDDDRRYELALAEYRTWYEQLHRELTERGQVDLS